MKIWKQLSEILGKPAHRKKGGNARDLLLEKYRSFQELLSQNNSALELMADMEAKLSGEFVIDRHYIDSSIAAVVERVKKIVDTLNQISGEKYLDLYDRFNTICSDMAKFLAKRKEIPVTSYTVPFDGITKEMVDSLGGKNANLGEVRNRLGLPTPDGFAISAYAFKRFMEHNELFGKINETLSELTVDHLEVIEHASRDIQERIIKTEIPQDLEEEILDAYTKLCSRLGKKVMVSMRSSALQEDGTFSFAGQYSTFLNVSTDVLLRKYKEVIASLFTPRAIFYYKTKGFYDFEIVMAVGVLAMIDAKAAGVMYSRDPNEPKAGTLISAVRGLGRCIVEGVITPETYVISKHYSENTLIPPLVNGGEEGLEINRRNIPEQESMIVCRSDGELEEIPLPEELKGKPILTDEQIKTLAKYAVSIENHYKTPQDIEWAIDKKGTVYILQTRPLLILKEKTRSVPTRIEGYNILIDRGVIACKGIGFGSAYIVRTEDDFKDFPEGAVLVAKHASTKYVTIMNKARAIITDIGAATVHMASLARESRIPSILDTEVATKIIRNGQELTVDAINCNVYEGHVRELEEFVKKRDEPFKGTHLFKTFERVLKWVVPLNLIDPSDKTFQQQFCETLHDITRFAHQKAMQEIFRISEELPEDVEPVRIVADIPLLVYLIDLGGGINIISKQITPADISSLPFNAFFKGLVALEWPGPRHVGAKSFFGMVAHTAEIPEAELERMAEVSFSFISHEYMNFSIRLGYHLSLVEAYTGKSINDNYIRFFFKGGGADRERRLRRVRLIGEVLKKMDFRVKIIEDIIDAMITKDKQSHLEEKLEVLGRLTVYTKQLDAIMHDDKSVEWHLEEFVRKYLTI